MSAEYLQQLDLGEREPQIFKEKLERLWKRGLFASVGLDSDWSKIPGEYKFLGREEGTFRFNQEIIDHTIDLVCAYKPNISFYEDDPASERALERTVFYLHEKYPYLPVIVDAKRGDIGNTNLGYVNSLFNRYRFDAVTVSPYLGREALQPFLDREEKGIIILAKTSNPGSDEFQNDFTKPVRYLAANREDMIDLMELTGTTDIPLYLGVAYRVARFWNKNNNCALVVGATYPSEMEVVRQLVGEMPILIPGIGEQGGELQKTVAAGMDKRTWGMIINSARGIIFAPREEEETVGQAARKAAEKLSKDINFYRQNPEGMTDSQKQLARALFEIGAIKFGSFRLKLHDRNPNAPLSPIYIDLRILRSAPEQVKLLVCQVYQDLIKDLSFDYLADIPTAITPVVSLLSHVTEVPMITPRTDKKSHGSGAEIDGIFESGKTAILFDDLISEGDSKFPPVRILERNGVKVKTIVTLIDREQKGGTQLASAGYELRSAYQISNLLRFALREGIINRSKYNEVTSYWATNYR